MGKIDKKRKKIQERIKSLEDEMRLHLTKKSSDTPEISIGEYRRKIMEAESQLEKLN